MKTLRIILGVTFGMLLLAPFSARATDDPMVFDSTDNYLGGCSYTNTSTWTLPQSLTVSKIQLWYNWQSGETSLPVTVKKDGADFATFTAVRGACDPYQATWCNADYAINKIFPAGTYTTAIANAYQCLKPGGTGTVRLYGTTDRVATTNVNSATNTSDDTVNTNTGLIAPSPAANENLNTASNANVAVTNAVTAAVAEDTAGDSSSTIFYVIIAILVVIILVLVIKVISCHRNKASS
ncbi:MAG: hypothetical protein V1778_00035 [bacterium]